MLLPLQKSTQEQNSGSKSTAEEFVAVSVWI